LHAERKASYAQGLVKCPMASMALVLHYRREPKSAMSASDSSGRQ